ncbi:MAG: response regulator [Chitinophagaceae bacterium]|nr:response regulator [Chitinophagaceae bacterium]
MRGWQYCLACLVWCSSLTAQAQNLSFHKLGVAEGLSQGSVLAITQDSRGFIWLGTRAGLNRFDGHGFRTYKRMPGNPGSLSSDYILALLNDHQGQLWVGVNGGLCRYLPETDRLQLIPGSSNMRVSALHEDAQGRLWMGSNLGLVVKEPGTLRFAAPIMAKGQYGLNGADIRAITSDSKGHIWVGTAGGLTRLHLQGQQWYSTTYRLDKAGTENASLAIRAIAEDNLQQIWVGTVNAGLYRLDTATSSFIPYLHQKGLPNSLVNNNIRQIMPDQKGRLWIGTQEGLSVFDPARNSFSNYQQDPDKPNSLSQNSIYSLFTDKAGNIWVGTYFGGANIVYAHNTPFQRQQYTRFTSSISNNVVSDFAEDRQGNLWIGTEGGGLNYWNRQTGQFEAFKNVVGDPSSLLSNLVKTVCLDQQGRVWVGTHGGGLSMLDPGTKRFTHYRPTPGVSGSLPSPDVSKVLYDSYGRLWVGTDAHGLWLLDEASQQFRRYLHRPEKSFQLSGSHVRCLYEDAEQNLWVATENGVNLLKAGSDQFTNFLADYPDAAGMQYSFNAVFRDNRNRIWLGSMNQGLILAGEKGTAWELFSKKNGLSGNTVYGILQDENGFLWTSTENGLSRLDIETRRIHNYNVHDGLPGNEFNFLSYFKDRRGEMFFGGFNGFCHFLPAQVQSNENTQPVQITGLQIHNYAVRPGDSTGLLQKDISQVPAIQLNHTQNVVTIEFALLNFIKPQKTIYTWKLEGYDKEWHEGHEHKAVYNNLPPGHYRFLVKAANNDGKWHSTPTELLIDIEPPIWKHTWAYILYALLMAAGSFLILRFLWMRARFKREASLQQFKLDFFTNISHEIRTHLSLILGPVEQMLMNKDNSPAANRQLLHVRSNADRLMRLVSEMMDLRKAETNHLSLHVTRENLLLFLHDVYTACEGAARAQGISMLFEAHCQEQDLYFDKMQMEKVFFNLLTNAVKFTPAGGTVRIVVEEAAQTVSIRIIDNGIGIPAGQISKLFTTYYQVDHGNGHPVGYGIGLALAKSLVNLHQGSLTVESKPAADGQEGYTCFMVTLLKGNSHYKAEELSAESPATTGTTAAANPAQVTATEGPDQQAILLVDDNAELRSFIRESLEGKYTLLESDNGQDGLRLAQEQIPDLIISDIMMPGLNGLELCRTLKQDQRTSHIPVILLSAKSTPMQQLEGMQMGADAYVTKPFSIQMLELQIANLLASRASMRQRYIHQVTLQPRNIEITNNDEAFLGSIIDIIDSHMDEESFGVGMLSQKMAMSQPVLYKKLKALTNMSVNDFIKSIKLKKAAMLLLTKKHTVNEVAYMVGFNDRKYFSREFKKQFGKTPSEYGAMWEDTV